MQLNQLVTLLKEGYDLESLRLYIHDLKDIENRDKIKELIRVTERMSSYVTNHRRIESDKVVSEYYDDWEFPATINKMTFESLVDFSEKTDERIKVTVEDYKEYYDSLITEEDSENTSLKMEIFNKDETMSFTAILPGRTVLQERQKEVNKYLPLNKTMDMNFASLVQYLYSASNAESQTISVPEAIARGAAYIQSATAVGKLIDSKLFMDLFKELF